MTARGLTTPLGILLGRCVAFLGSVLFAGCIILPIPTPFAPPYIVGENVGLAAGTTTRADVVQDLGEPAATYCEGRELVYSAFQQRGIWLAAALMPVPPLVIPVAETTKYGKAHLLTLRFSESGVLSSYELAVAKSKGFWGAGPKCTPEGTCMFDGAVVRYATIDIDAQAKQFEPVADKCAVYVYSENSHDALKVDDAQVAPMLAPDGFAWILLEPGMHVLWVTSAAAPLWMDSERATNFRTASGMAVLLRVNCEAGSRLFVRPQSRDGRAKGRSELVLLDGALAQPTIAARRLILAVDPLGVASCGKAAMR